LIIAGTGNAGDKESEPRYPAKYSSVLAVGAIDINNNIWSKSNRGEDVLAPGVNIYSTIPTGYAYKDGTSMATPHVTGVAAFAWALYPHYSAAEIFNLIVSTTDHYNVVDAYLSDSVGGGGSCAPPNLCFNP
jgi:subtilisin